MKSIIRIEHEDGWGLFRRVNYNNTCDMTDRLESLRERHLYFKGRGFPTPFRENIKFVEGTHFCAFKNIRQVKRWVKPDEFKILLENGFKVYLIHVNKYIEGRKQIVYEKSDIISKKDISSKFLI